MYVIETNKAVVKNGLSYFKHSIIVSLNKEPELNFNYKALLAMKKSPKDNNFHNLINYYLKFIHHLLV